MYTWRISMPTIYSVMGMHCRSCEQKVGGVLAAIPGVKSAEVSVESGTATIDAEPQVSLAELQAAVRAAGDYRLIPQEVAGDSCPLPTSSSPQSWLETYRPLLVIVAYITGGTLLWSAISGDWSAMSLMNRFMGLFFVVFSLFKFLDVRGFARAFSEYDVVAARWPAYGFIYPAIELLLGVAFLAHLWSLATALTTFVIMTVGAVGVVKAVTSGQEIQCACLGTALNLPMSTVTIIEDISMALMAAVMAGMLLA